MMKTAKWLVFTSSLLLFSACNSSSDTSLVESVDQCRQSAIAYDGEKEVNLTQEQCGLFALEEGSLSTTVDNNYLLVVHGSKALPSYQLKNYTGQRMLLKAPDLAGFLNPEPAAYISGFITKASIGGRTQFRSGLTALDAKRKIRISELDAGNAVKREFDVQTDATGKFGVYVPPGKYRIVYGKKKEFELGNGENGIFLASMVTMVD